MPATSICSPSPFVRQTVWILEWSCHGRINYKYCTPNPICRLFFKIDLLTDFAALCLTEFIDWRYIHSWMVFSTQLVNCCPHGRRSYRCVLLPLYTFSLTSPPPSQTKCTVYTDNVCLWGEMLNCDVDHILQEFYTNTRSATLACSANICSRIHRSLTGGYIDSGIGLSYRLM
jgi:hypothetical protein